MKGTIVAVLDWRAGVALKDNVRLLEKAAAAGRVTPRDWRAGAAKYRSLSIRADGSCELQRWRAVTMGRRLAGPACSRTAESAGIKERG